MLDRIRQAREGTAIALRALLANKTRSLLTTLGIIIGVLTVTVMMMIIQGLNGAFANQISIIGSNTIYVEKWPWIITDNSWWKYINRPNIRVEDYEYLREHSELAEAVGAANHTRRSVGYRDKLSERVIISGVTPGFFIASNLPVSVGRSLSELDERGAGKVTVIGEDVREELFGSLDPMGRRIRIGNLAFTVVGILERKGRSFGQSMDNRVAVPLSTFRQTFGHRRSIEIAVMAGQGGDLDRLEDEATYLMRRSRNIKPLDENNFVINRQEMLTSFYKRITAGVYGAGLIIGGIALLVGGVGIMNIMLVSVAERTWEIGMRKAIGARTGSILWQFLIEAMLICTLGGLIGLGLAAAAGAALSSQLPVSLPLWLAASAVAFSGGIGLLFGLFPAARAARLDPVVALRSE